MALSDAEPFPWRSLWPIAALIAAVVVGILIYGAARGHSSTSPSAVAAAIGAQSCDDSGFTISTLISGQETVYDCSIDGNAYCVTYKGGLATDSTSVVKLAFANTLGSVGPSCLD